MHLHYIHPLSLARARNYVGQRALRTPERTLEQGDADHYVLDTTAAWPCTYTRAFQGGFLMCVRYPMLALLSILIAHRAAALNFTEYVLSPGRFASDGAYTQGMVRGPDGTLWFSESAGSRIGRISINGTTPEASVSLTEYSVPTNPLGICVGPDAAIWFTLYESNRVGRLDPLGSTTVYPLDTTTFFPTAIINSSDIWALQFGGFATGAPITHTSAIARITADGRVTTYPLGSDLFATEMKAAPDGTFWFLKQSGGIGRFSKSGSVSTVPLSATVFGIGLTFAPDGAAWITDERANAVHRVDNAGTVRSYSIPTQHAVPRGIAAANDGTIWFTEFAANKIGRIDVEGTVSEFSIPSANSGPTDIEIGADGAPWFVEALASKIGRVLKGGQSTTLIIPAAASITGLNGTHFKSSLALLNRSPQPTTVQLRLRCLAGLPCGGERDLAVAAEDLTVYDDVLASLFGETQAAGTIEVVYDSSIVVLARSRVATSTALGTYGAGVPAVPLASAASSGTILGVSSQGADLSIGFRTNAGAYNPRETATTVTFTVRSPDGTVLGTVAHEVPPQSPYQFPPNIFLQAGIQTAVEAAYLEFSATAPVIAYATLIDNRSGDSTFLLPADMRTPCSAAARME
jgi:virginiamycin B lyase